MINTLLRGRTAYRPHDGVDTTSTSTLTPEDCSLQTRKEGRANGAPAGKRVTVTSHNYGNKMLGLAVTNDKTRQDTSPSLCHQTADRQTDKRTLVAANRSIAEADAQRVFPGAG